MDTPQPKLSDYTRRAMTIGSNVDPKWLHERVAALESRCAALAEALRDYVEDDECKYGMDGTCDPNESQCRYCEGRAALDDAAHVAPPGPHGEGERACGSLRTAIRTEPRMHIGDATRDDFVSRIDAAISPARAEEAGKEDIQAEPPTAMAVRLSAAESALRAAEAALISDLECACKYGPGRACAKCDDDIAALKKIAAALKMGEETTPPAPEPALATHDACSGCKGCCPSCEEHCRRHPHLHTSGKGRCDDCLEGEKPAPEPVRFHKDANGELVREAPPAPQGALGEAIRQLESGTGRVADCIALLRRAAAEHAEVIQQRDDASKKHLECADGWAKAAAERQKAEQERDALRAEVARLGTAHAEAERQRETWEAMCKSARDEVKRLKKEIASFQSSIAQKLQLAINGSDDGSGVLADPGFEAVRRWILRNRKPVNVAVVERLEAVVSELSEVVEGMKKEVGNG